MPQSVTSLPSVYPRVGGGNSGNTCELRALGGLSPRGRGKQGETPPSLWLYRSIPAWAGETIPCVSARWVFTVYPRVGGGNPLELRI